VLRNRQQKHTAIRCHSLQEDILQTIKLIKFDFLSLSEQKKGT
jgi:hypothetical protein